MEKYFNGISIVIALVGGYFGKLFGGWDMLLQAVIWLMILDYATGIIKGIYTKKLSSEIGFKGILKKILILIVIATACVLDKITGGVAPIREIVIMFYICNESLSLLENAAEFIPVSDKLKNTLLQLRDKNEKESE